MPLFKRRFPSTHPNPVENTHHHPNISRDMTMQECLSQKTTREMQRSHDMQNSQSSLCVTVISPSPSPRPTNEPTRRPGSLCSKHPIKLPQRPLILPTTPQLLTGNILRPIRDAAQARSRGRRSRSRRESRQRAAARLRMRGAIDQGADAGD